jgi:site-specific DNA-methyltransferase (adenine-specific)
MSVQLNTIYNEDCLETMRRMPDGFVDLIVTDPSYSLPNNQFRPEARTKQRTFGEFSAYQHFFRLFIEQANRILKANGDIAIFCDETFYPVIYPMLYEYFYATKLLVWDKGRIGMGGIWRRQFELVAYSYKQPKKTKSGDSDILKFPSVRQKLHTSQKPVELIEKFIEKSTNEGDVVADFFMGSGTTAVACKKLNRNYIGSEISAEYCKIAENRLRQEVLL